VLLLLATWQVTAMLIPAHTVLPPPSRVFQAAVEMWHSGELFQDVCASLNRVVVGFLLALSVVIASVVADALYYFLCVHNTVGCGPFAFLDEISYVTWALAVLCYYGVL